MSIFTLYLILQYFSRRVVLSENVQAPVDRGYSDLPSIPFATNYASDKFDPDNDLVFCTTSCHDTVHVACKCNKNVNSFCYPYAHDQRKEVRKAAFLVHNTYRNKIAIGREINMFMGNASNMHLLRYDLGLEYTAWCNVIQCAMKESPCSITKALPHVSQNMWSLDSVEDGMDPAELVQKAIRIWFDEIRFIEHKSFVDKYRPKDDYRHFSRMIWAEVTHVGCAIGAERSLIRKKRNNIFVTCNYGSVKEEANEPGMPVYLRGQQLGNCTSKDKSKLFPALCGKLGVIPIAPMLPDSMSNTHRMQFNLTLATLLSFLHYFLKNI